MDTKWCLHRRSATIRTVAAACLLASLAGCEAAQLANRTINQSSYIPDLQYRQVMDNLAIIADNPSALPYFNPPNTSKTTIQRTAQTNFGMQWSPIAALSRARTIGMAPLSTAITKMYEPLVVTQIAPGVQGTQQAIEEWDTALVLDPIRSVVMQGLYRKVLNAQCTPFQLRLMQKFFYDYPNDQFNDPSMLFPDGLTPPYLQMQEITDRQTSLQARVDAAVKPPIAMSQPAASASASAIAPVTSATVADNSARIPNAPATTVKTPAPPIPAPSPLAATDLIAQNDVVAIPALSTRDARYHLLLAGDLKQSFAFDELDIIGRLNRLSLCNSSQEITRKHAVCLAQIVADMCGERGLPDQKLQAAVTAATHAMANLAMQIQMQRPIRERGDTYANYNAEFRELYHNLQPGWVGRGTRKDVPKNACYVGNHGHTYVWVTPDHLEQLTNLTIAVVDTATADTSSATLTSNPISGGPPSLTPDAKKDGATRAFSGGTEPTTYSVPYFSGLPARARVNQTPPPGPNVVPAPPAAAGMFR